MRQMPGLPVLDSVEERLLNVFAAAWQTKTDIPVSTAAQMISDTSERTVYRRLKTLESKGLIAFEADEQDQRIRYIVPTARTDDYFDKLGRCIERAQGT